MKRTGKCPKCGGGEVMRLALVGDASDYYGQGSGGPDERRGHQLVPRQILATETHSRSFLGGTSTTYQEGGQTEGYVCTACGYLEEYVLDVGSIDWSQVVGATRHRPIS